MSSNAKSESVSWSKLAFSSALLRCSECGGTIRGAWTLVSNTKGASSCSRSVSESLGITCSSPPLVLHVLRSDEKLTCHA